MHSRIFLVAFALLVSAPALAQTPPKIAAPTAPVAPTPPQTAPAAAAPVPADPCAAYMASYQAYTMCQDRVQKIQRMKDAIKNREDALNPPPPPEKKPAESQIPAPATESPKK